MTFTFKILILICISTQTLSAQSGEKNFKNTFGIKLFQTNAIGSGFGFQYERKLFKNSFLSVVFPVDISLDLKQSGFFDKVFGLSLNPGIRFNFHSYNANYFYSGVSLLFGSSNEKVGGYDFQQLKEVSVNINRSQMVPSIQLGVQGLLSRRVLFMAEVEIGYRLKDKITSDANVNTISRYEIYRPNEYPKTIFFGLGYNF